MRYGFVLVALASAGLAQAGCSAGPSLPSAPSAPAKPEAPTMAPRPSAPAASSASKAAEPAVKAAAPVDRTPIKADLSKIQFKSESAELFG